VQQSDTTVRYNSQLQHTASEC